MKKNRLSIKKAHHDYYYKTCLDQLIENILRDFLNNAVLKVVWKVRMENIKNLWGILRVFQDKLGAWRFDMNMRLKFFRILFLHYSAIPAS